MRMKARLAAAVAASAIGTPVIAAPIVVDWTTIDAVTDVATGLLGAVSVTLTGPIDGGLTNGSAAGFSGPAFVPPLAATDVVYIGGTTTGRTYTINFSSAVLNPLLYLSSLASTLTFAPGTSLTELSDDGNLTVAGNQVSGITQGSSDANGIVQVNGVFTSLSFSALFSHSSGDGIAFQLAASPNTESPPSSVPEPGTYVLMLAGLAAAVGASKRRRA